MIRIELAFDGTSVVFSFSVQKLIAVVPLQWFHLLHPKVIGEGADDVHRLLESMFDFKPKTVEANNLNRLQRGVRRHQDAAASARMNNHHKTNQTASGSPQ